MDLTFNFGQRPFAYTAPSGYKALCTANLDDPTIADGSDHFDIATYGGGASSYTISGLSFSPDLVWSKRRDSAGRPALVDTVRGATIQLSSDRTSADLTISDGLEQFNSDGYVVGTDAGEYGWNGGVSSTFVNWIWNAGTSTVSNTDGTITASVRANPSAGFSIVSYTGNGTAGATVGHGLNDAPELIFVKRRDTSSGWRVYQSAIGATKHLRLDSTAAEVTSTVYWNDTEPTSSVFSIGNNTDVNATSGTFITYCFAPVEGYSAFGSYEGTGSGGDNGPFVALDFQPAFILIKSVDYAGDWYLYDNGRFPSNPKTGRIFANTNGAEGAVTDDIDFLSNGFKIRTSGLSINGSGTTHVYYAVAENPFKTAPPRSLN